MLAPYRDVLSRPNAWKFSLAGVLARLPISMVGIGVVLLVSDQRLYGSYALAGQVSAVYVIAQAVAAPQIARLVDRYGQARIMRPAIALSMTALAALAVAGARLAPPVLLMVLAAVVGLTMGSIGSLVRTRWNAVVRTPKELHTAYSLESVFDEVVFVIGPVLATILATSFHPTVGIAVAITAAVVGGYLFLAQRASEPLPTGRAVDPEHRGSLLRSPALLVIIVVFVCMGTIFGATDVSTVAFAEEVHRKDLAGVILACFAFGSGIGGLLYGARHWRSPLWARFAIGNVALAAGVSLFFFSSSLLTLAGTMAVVGLVIAPTLVNGNALVQEIVPGPRLTEGLTWIGTALGVGVATGSAIAGPLIDAHGSHAGFLVSTGAGVLATLVTVTSMAALRRRRAARANVAAVLDAVEPSDGVEPVGPVGPSG
ncbi:MAG: MFS transporter, partial [Micrococcales bacterium 73-15]